MAGWKRDDKSEAEILENAATASQPSEGNFRCVTGSCLLARPSRNSREKTAESNNGQLLAKGGKHIRPQDRDFPMNTETKKNASGR
jgi:hypothetical protein